MAIKKSSNQQEMLSPHLTIVSGCGKKKQIIFYIFHIIIVVLDRGYVHGTSYQFIGLFQLKKYSNMLYLHNRQWPSALWEKTGPRPVEGNDRNTTPVMLYEGLAV